MEGFGSFEGVIKTKGELYDFLRKKGNSTIFIHHDNPYLMNIAKGLNLISYGSGEDLYVNGCITGNSPYLALKWKAEKNGEIHRIRTQLIGEYNFPNALAAITIGRFFGVEDRKIDEALAGYTPQNNRSQLKETADNTLIIDAYNANPTSMAAALQNFRNMTVSHKMLILGDMRELGTVVACLGRSVLLPRAVQRVCRIAARILYQLPWRRLAGFCSKFYRSIARKSGCLLCGASKNDETVIINILLLS